MANTVKKLVLAAATFAGACTTGLQQARMNQVNAEAQETYAKKCASPTEEKLETLRERAISGEASALEARQHALVLEKGNQVCASNVELKRLRALNELDGGGNGREIMREEQRMMREMFAFKNAACEEHATLDVQTKIGAKRGTLSKSAIRAIYNEIASEKATCLSKAETWLEEERAKYKMAYDEDATLDDYMEQGLTPAVKATEPAKTKLEKPATP